MGSTFKLTHAIVGGPQSLVMWAPHRAASPYPSSLPQSERCKRESEGLLFPELCPPPNLNVEELTPNVTVFRDKLFKELVKLKLVLYCGP